MSLNFTQILATNICDASSTKLAAGTISFQAVDGSNRPISFQPGGGGSVVTTPATATITNGAIVGTFQVANPENTIPAGILYNITITDTNLKKVVTTYSLVAISGNTFNLDAYTSGDAGNVVGSTINGPLVVTGNLSVTGQILTGVPGTGPTSKLATFSFASTTWTVTHNFGSQAVVAQCYDNNWHQILPDTLTQTDVNTTTATFVLPQTGYLVVLNVGNWSPSVANPLNIIANPSSSQTIAGDYPFTFGGSLVAKRFAGVRYADQFGSIAAAFADLPSTGGVIILPHGYTETLTANLTLNKHNTVIWALGSAQITMNAFQVIVPANTFGICIKGTIPFGDAYASPYGFLWTYTGNSKAFQIGNGAGVTTRWIDIENVAINLSGSTGVGIYMTNVVYFSMNRVYVAGSNLIGQTGIVLDGTGNFCGTGTIINPNIAFLGTAIKGVSTLNGADAMNAVTIIGGTLATNVVGGIGLNIDSGFQNTVLGTDFESNTIAVRFGADTVDNYVDIRSEANTTDFTAISGSSRNIGKARGNASIVVSDSGTNNHFYRPIDGDFDTITNESGIVSKVTGGTATLTANTATTSQKFIQLSNTGHTGFYYGIESSVGGAFFTGSNAYEAVLYSPTNNLFIKSPLVRFSGTPVIAGGAAPTVAAGQVGLGTTTATSATAGTNGAVPAQVANYLIINVGGTNFKVPYFNV